MFIRALALSLQLLGLFTLLPPCTINNMRISELGVPVYSSMIISFLFQSYCIAPQLLHRKFMYCTFMCVVYKEYKLASVHISVLCNSELLFIFNTRPNIANMGTVE